MDWALYWRLPPKDEVTSDTLLDRFLDYVAAKDLSLYPAQEEAILALLDGKNVILNTTTGSGKSLVAMALHFQSLARGRRSFYTCPIKALVNEKFRDLCRDFGPDQVGMMTGDGSVNPQAPIICCTAEILSNLALREGQLAPVDDVVMDEFHYYADRQRGMAWQIPLLTLPQTRFLLMSATLGEMDFFAEKLTRLTGQDTDLVRGTDRPVPLDFAYSEKPLHETVSELVNQGRAPIYLVNFSQREAAEEAQNLMSLDFTAKEDKKKIAEMLIGEKFQSPYGKDLQKHLRHGLGLHHAGLLPRYRTLVERLAQAGLLKVISGTDTLGVGVNVPIRTVLFTKLCKYDGEKTSVLSVREFQQISGRAGRRGFDAQGYVVAQAPAHVVENLRMKFKAADDPKKQKKLVMKTAPTFGFVMWSQETFQRLISSLPETLTSSFDVTHGMLLNVLSRPHGGRRALQTLIRDSHENPKRKKYLRGKAFTLFRALLERKIVEVVRLESGYEVRVNANLQDDFSLHQSLALYLLDALQVLDRDHENYTLDLLTLVESILENPDLILRRQLDRVKTLKMAEMKAAGMEYEERMEELEKLEHPKPNRDFIYATFQIFAQSHPWIGQESIRPKSVAREMYENFHSFAEYIREYDLHRVEGLLLRYLSEVYKTLEQSVPDAAKTEDVEAMIVYFGTMVRQVDSSLLEDWEKMRTKGDMAAVASSASLQTGAGSSVGAPDDLDIVRNEKRFLTLVRHEIHCFLRLWSSGDHQGAAELLTGSFSPEVPWTATELEKVLNTYLEDHRGVRTDPPARHPQNSTLFKMQDHWEVEQRLIDLEEHNDWALRFHLDLAASRAAAKPVLNLISVSAIL